MVLRAFATRAETFLSRLSYVGKLEDSFRSIIHFCIGVISNFSLSELILVL
jgi:hypothetical protein